MSLLAVDLPTERPLGDGHAESYPRYVGKASSPGQKAPRPSDPDPTVSKFQQPESRGYTCCGLIAFPEGSPDMKKVHMSTSPSFGTFSPRQAQTEAPRERPRLPHERDESARETGKHEKPARTGSTIEQAREDVERGLVDTERRGTPNNLPTHKTK